MTLAESLVNGALNPVVTTGLIMALTMLASCGVLFALFRNPLSGRRDTLKRLSIDTGIEAHVTAGSEAASEERPKHAIEHDVCKLAQPERAPDKPRLGGAKSGAAARIRRHALPSGNPRPFAGLPSSARAAEGESLTTSSSSSD